MDDRGLYRPRLTRRGLLGNGGALLAGAWLASCDLLSTDPTSSRGGGDAGGGRKEKESPMLAAKVGSGELPPLQERVPDQPLVIQPMERLGQYGGEWNSVIIDTDRPEASLNLTVGYDQLVHWDPAYTKVVPNIAKAIEVLNGGREYVFKLHQGIRWSDGEPFTAEDIVFAYEDVWHGIVGIVPATLTADGDPPQLEKVDDYTVRFLFPRPHGLFLERLATGTGAALTAHPRHYLEQFHKKYNSNVDDVVETEGFDDPTQLFLTKADRWANVDLPVLSAWKVTTAVGEEERVVLERNPYYWKTDPEGRQLPYIDRVVFEVVNSETLLLKAANGEVDLQVRYLATNLADKPVLGRSRQEGDYRFLDITPDSANYTVIMLNLTHDDQVLREVFRNKDFRIGLSYAINRAEIIDAVFQRQGQPWQAAPRPDSPFFHEGLAKQHLDYDVAKANQYLDRAGYTDRDNDGFRLRPDGKPISFTVELSGQFPFWADTMELVRAYWKEVGIDIRIRNEDARLFYERKTANLHDATVWRDLMGLRRGPMLDPRFYFPYSAESNYAIPWANWYNGADPKEEPPEPTKRQMELYDQIKTTTDETEQQEIASQIMDIAADEFYVIGTVMPEGDYGIIRNNFHNVYEPMPNGFLYRTPGSALPEQFFIQTS